MKDVDSKLLTSLRLAKKQPMYFAFVAKGATDGVLIVAKKKIPVKVINEAKAESGGRKVFRGRCQGEDGLMIFEMAKEPPNTLAKVLKKVIKVSAGVMMQVEARVDPDLAEEEAEDEGAEEETQDGVITPAPPPPAQLDHTARFTARLKALAPVLQKVESVKGLQAKEAKQAVAEANTLFRAHKYEDALETLDIAEGLMKEALLAAAEASPAQPIANDAARFATRLKALAPVLQKAEATGSQQVKNAKLRIAEANKYYVAKQFEQANASLDHAETHIKRALVAATQTPTPSQPSTNDAMTQFTARLKALMPTYQAAVRAAPNHKPTLDKLMAQAGASAKARKFQEGLVQLDELEAAIQNAKPAETPPAKLGAEKNSTGAETEENSSALNELALEFESVLKTLRPKLTRAVDLARRTKNEDAAEFNASLNNALELHQAEDYEKAYDVLTTLDARITAFLRNAKAQAEIRNAAGPENVAYVVSKLEWDKARSNARAELSKFQAAILNDPATKEDPRYHDSIVPTVRGLDKILASFDDRINVALDEAAALPAQQKGPSIQKALDLIGEYRQAISTNQMIKMIDSGAYGSANLAGVLTGALDTMSKRLTKRLKAT